MSNHLVFVGFIVILIGVLIIILGSSSKNVKFAFGGFVGPIPFGFANDPRMLWVVIILTIVILILFLSPLIRGLL